MPSMVSMLLRYMGSREYFSSMIRSRASLMVASIEIAQMKARTAIKMKRPSKAFEDMIAGGRNAVLKLPDVLGVEGGLPLVVDGQFVGAIGVSGVTSAQDGQIAAAGVKALEGAK